jgi:peroxisomal membrane protein 2
VKDAPYFIHALSRLHVDIKAFKMAIYGFLISAPLSHTLTGALQKAFAGKTGPAAKIGQILANSVLISPITTSSKCSELSEVTPLTHSKAYLASMAIINGAKTFNEIVKTVQAGFWPVLKV